MVKRAHWSSSIRQKIIKGVGPFLLYNNKEKGLTPLGFFFLSGCSVDGLKKGVSPRFLDLLISANACLFYCYIFCGEWSDCSASLLCPYLSPLRTAKEERRLEIVDKLQDKIQHHGGAVTLRDLERRHKFKRKQIEELVKEYPGLLEIVMRATLVTGGRPSYVLKIPEW